jgi:AcrR family transcriptional regulator
METRDRILSAAYRLCYREGFARVSVDAIAAAAGVTKRTVYYHFQSKDQIVAAVLDNQHSRALAQIQKWGRNDAPTARDFVAGLFKQLELWASKPKWLGSGFTRLAMELADLPGHPARHAAHHHKVAVEDWLITRLRELNVGKSSEVARQLVVLMEGSVALTLIHGDVNYIASAAQTAIHIVDPKSGLRSDSLRAG